MLEVDEIVRRMDKRDGTSVVSYREVGLPIFRLNALLTLEETGPLSAIEEFVMRAIGAGIETCEEISTFLGLPRKLIVTQLVQSMSDWTVATSPADSTRFQLTSKGKALVAEAKSTRIERDQIPLYIDGITRDVISVESRDLWTGSQLFELDVSAVSPIPRRSPKPHDVDLVGVNRMFQLYATADRPTRRAVRLDATLGRTLVFYRRALAVAFKSSDGKQMTIAFAVNGRESQPHEVAFARADESKRTAVFASLFDSDKRRRDVQAVVRELKSDVPTLPQAPVSRGRQIPVRIKNAQGVAEPLRVQTLSVYDHPPMLRNAFANARSRILLISPWIRANVVNDDFIRRLTSCLSRGVDVTIAYGIGRKDPNEREKDVEARNHLEALERSFSNFHFVRKGNTHAKVLLVDDDYFVTTSFNWLSFMGDPKQPMREEEGTLVRDQDAVREYYERLMERVIEAQSPNAPV